MTTPEQFSRNTSKEPIDEQQEELEHLEDTADAARMAGAYLHENEEKK